MKKIINLFLIGIILTSIAFTSCSKDDNSSSSNNNDNTSSLALTSENIEGSWEVINRSTGTFTRFDFLSNETYSVYDGNNLVAEGAYIIHADSKLLDLEFYGRISDFVITSTSFNFKLAINHGDTYNVNTQKPSSNNDDNNAVTIGSSYSSNILVESDRPYYWIDVADDEFGLNFETATNFIVAFTINGQSIPDGNFSRTFSRNEVMLDFDNIPEDTNDDYYFDDLTSGTISISRAGNTWEVNLNLSDNNGVNIKLYYKGELYRFAEGG